MNNISTGRTLRSLRRAAWFSFVTAPALAFFFTFIFLSFNNSLAGTFLNEARRLVAGTPPGKVWVCAPPVKTAEEERMLAPLPLTLPPPPVLKPRCEPVMTDEASWQQSADSTIRDTYKSLVIMGAVIWWLCNNMAGPVGACRWFKEKMVRMNAARRTGRGSHSSQDKE